MKLFILFYKHKETLKEGFMVVRAVDFSRAMTLARSETKNKMQLLFFDETDWRYNLGGDIFFKYEEYV